MRQWDIYVYPFTLEQPHPVVILSIDERVIARKFVNGLLCVTLRGGARLRETECLLDQADGLEWATAVRCDLIHQLERSRFSEKRGEVSIARQQQISRKLVECFRLKL